MPCPSLACHHWGHSRTRAASANQYPKLSHLPLFGTTAIRGWTKDPVTETDTNATIQESERLRTPDLTGAGMKAIT
jgi:hypothetical protein